MALVVCLAGCGDDDGSGGSGGGGGEGAEGGSSGGSDPSIVEPGAPTYEEMAEATNGDKAGGEVTALTLGEEGFVIEGLFEADAPTTDHYQFNTGAHGGAAQPDLPGIDAFVFIDGKLYDSGQSDVHLTLDAVADDGFSTLSLGGFDNAAVTSGVEYDVGVSVSNPALYGKAYRLEVRGHVE